MDETVVQQSRIKTEKNRQKRFLHHLLKYDSGPPRTSSMCQRSCARGIQKGWLENVASEDTTGC